MMREAGGCMISGRLAGLGDGARAGASPRCFNALPGSAGEGAHG